MGGGKCEQFVRLTTLPPSRADCLEILGPQTPGNLRDCTRMALSSKGKKKVKYTLAQALRLCTGRTAHGGVEV